jgi:hypothetical protein
MTRPSSRSLACWLVPLSLAVTATAELAAQSAPMPAAYTPVRDLNPLILPPKVPLRVTATQTIPLRKGQPFYGRLAEPVYGPDRLLLPEGTTAEGVIAGTPSLPRGERINAKLDGDFTPLREPTIRVTQLTLPSGAVVHLDAEGGIRNATTISLGRPAENTSLWKRMKDLARGRVKQARDTVRDTRQEPHKGDKLKQMLYRQLPYHPQRVWAGSTFDAVLQGPLLVPPNPKVPPMPHASNVDLTSGVLQARLVSGVSSKSAKRHDTVSAVLVRPFCDPKGEVMLPTGTALDGLVLESKPARSFGRNGKLRFSFRNIAMPPAPRQALQTERIQGNLSAIQAQPGQNVAIDEEGGTRAQPDNGRFLAPLVLGLMAVASQDDDGGVLRQGVTSNGFGLVARVVTMAAASRNASTGFAAFAFSKSIYKRYIARGHEVTFPTDTEMAISLGRR